MRIAIKNLLWLVPFACFAFGYVLPYLFFSVSTTTVPNLIAQSTHHALEQAAAHNLSLKLLRTQEDATVPAGTVLFQTPSADRSVRPHQTVLVIVSCLPEQHKAPACVGSTEKEVTALLQEQKIPYTLVPVPSDKPNRIVIGQEPQADTPLQKQKLVLYVSNNQEKIVLMPSCITLTVQQAYEFFMLHGLQLDAYHECNQELSSCQCTITDQKPLAGCCIDLKKAPHIMVRAKR